MLTLHPGTCERRRFQTLTATTEIPTLRYHMAFTFASFHLGYRNPTPVRPGMMRKERFADARERIHANASLSPNMWV